MKFDIFPDYKGRGWIVKRMDIDKYEMHAHLVNAEACKRLVKLIEAGLLPKNEWMQGSCRRLLTRDEYDRLKKPKEKYLNSKDRWR